MVDTVTDEKTLFLSIFGLHKPKNILGYYNTEILDNDNNYAGCVVEDENGFNIMVTVNHLMLSVIEGFPGNFDGSILECQTKKAKYKYSNANKMHSLIDINNKMFLSLSQKGITTISNGRMIIYKLDDFNNGRITSEDMELVSTTIKHFNEIIPSFFEAIEKNCNIMIEDEKIKQLLN